MHQLPTPIPAYDQLDGHRVNVIAFAFDTDEETGDIHVQWIIDGESDHGAYRNRHEILFL